MRQLFLKNVWMQEKRREGCREKVDDLENTKLNACLVKCLKSVFWNWNDVKCAELNKLQKPTKTIIMKPI